jgi:multiple sugar transport system permease protein
MTLTFAATPRTRSPEDPRPRTSRGRAARRSLTGWGFAGPATLLVVGLSIFPAVWAFFISRTKWNGIAPATDVGWRNYQRIATDPDAIAAAQHTLVLTVLFVPGSDCRPSSSWRARARR